MTFNGTWKVDRSDNYDKFMEQMGVNIMKRKLAEHDNLKVTIEQTGDNFHIKESSTFRTKDIDFTLGVPFDYGLADGTEVSVSELKWFQTLLNQQQQVQLLLRRVNAMRNGLLQGTWEMEGDMLKGKFTRKDNSKVLTTTRALVGGELVQTYSYEGVDAKRIFKKQ